MDLIRLHIIYIGVEMFFEDDEEEYSSILEKVWALLKKLFPVLVINSFSHILD